MKMVQLVIGVASGNVPVLAARSLAGRFLFEQPTILGVLMLVAGVLGAVVVSRWAGLKKGALVLGGCVLGALSVVVLSTAVETEYEAFRDRSRGLVFAVAEVDEAVLMDLLGEDVQLNVLGIRGLDVEGREAVLGRIRARMGGDAQVSNYRVLETQVKVDGPRTARSQVWVRVTSEQWRVVNVSTWRLIWRLDGEQWRVVEIRALRIGGVG